MSYYYLGYLNKEINPKAYYKANCSYSKLFWNHEEHLYIQESNSNFIYVYVFVCLSGCDYIYKSIQNYQTWFIPISGFVEISSPNLEG